MAADTKVTVETKQFLKNLDETGRVIHEGILDDLKAHADAAILRVGKENIIPRNFNPPCDIQIRYQYTSHGKTGWSTRTYHINNMNQMNRRLFVANQRTDPHKVTERYGVLKNAFMVHGTWTDTGRRPMTKSTRRTTIGGVYAHITPRVVGNTIRYETLFTVSGQNIGFRVVNEYGGTGRNWHGGSFTIPKRPFLVPGIEAEKYEECIQTIKVLNEKREL